MRLLARYAAALAVAAASPLLAQDAAQSPVRVGVGVIERKLALTEAIEQALRNNLEVEIERNNTAYAAQAVRAAQGAFDTLLQFRPTLESATTPTGSALSAADGRSVSRTFGQNAYLRQRLSKYGTAFHVDWENGRLTTNNPFTSLNPYYTSRLFIGITQPLLRNREMDLQRAELLVSRKQVEVAESDYELKIIDIVSRVEQAYWDLVAARDDVALKAETVELARLQRSINDRLVSSGTLAPVELEASNAELERRLDDYYTAVGNVTTVENRLKALLASSRADALWSDVLIPVDRDPRKEPDATDLPALVAEAVRRRPELRQVGQRQEVAAIQKRFAADQRKPQIDVVAGYANQGLAGSALTTGNPFSASTAGIYAQLNKLSAVTGVAPLPVPSATPLPVDLVGNYGSSLGNLFSGRFPTFQAGVNIDLTLRNRTAEANFNQATLTEKRLRLEQARSEQTVEQQVRDALQGLQTAKQRIVATDASVRAAKAKLDSETRLFQTGESTNFLVLTRQNEYADSRRRANVARLDLNKSISRLEQAMGTTLSTYAIRIR